MTPGSDVTARPAVYVEVTINGQRTVYDISTARQLRDELTAALRGLDPDASEFASDTPQKDT